MSPPDMRVLRMLLSAALANNIVCWDGGLYPPTCKILDGLCIDTGIGFVGAFISSVVFYILQLLAAAMKPYPAETIE